MCGIGWEGGGSDEIRGRKLCVIVVGLCFGGDCWCRCAWYDGCMGIDDLQVIKR